MVKQAESLWSESRSQPHPLFENVPEAHESTRARVWVQRAVAWGAGAAALIFLLYVFWLRATPPLLFGPLGPVGGAEQGRSLGLPDGGLLALLEELSQPPAERARTQLHASNAVGSGNGARSEPAKEDGGLTEAGGSGRPLGVAAEGGEAPASFGTEGEGYGSEPRRAPGVAATDNPPDSGGGSGAENGGASAGSSPGVGGDTGAGQDASDDDDGNGNGNGNGGGNGNGNGGGNGNGNGGGNGNGDDDGNGNGDDDDNDEDDQDEDDEESDEEEDDGDDEDDEDEDGGLF